MHRYWWHYSLIVFALLGSGCAFLFWMLDLSLWSEYVSVIVLVGGGLPLAFRILSSLRKGLVNVDIIAIVAIVGALYLHEYVAGAIIVLMLSGGEALETFARARAKRALQLLLDASPKTAHVLKGTKNIRNVPLASVAINDTIVIKQGEMVPIDCVLLRGLTHVDQSNLTGESLPSEKTAGDTLLSGSINLTTLIHARVIRSAKDSAFSQIVSLIASAENNKARTETIANTYGALFTPFVLVFAGAVFFITRDIHTTYAVFVVATPCPLLIATPVAMISAIARAATMGVIVKNGTAIETLASVTALVFDKTGTLTEGKPQVTDVHTFSSSHTAPDIIGIAGALSQYSSHVFSESIVHTAYASPLLRSPLTHFAEVAGQGLSGTLKNKAYFLGNVSFFENQKISLSPAVQRYIQKSLAKGISTVLIGTKKECIGVLLIADTLRADASQLISSLRAQGIEKLVVATGDTEAVAQSIAKQVGLHEVYADTRPEHKAHIIQHLQKRGYIVGMVGDGLNDAPAMSVAHVGIAIGARGSSVTAENADAVLVSHDIRKVGDVITLSRAALRIARFGIIGGMGASVVGMVAASVGLLPPVSGAIAQEVIDVVVILNALRVLRIRV